VACIREAFGQSAEALRRIEERASAVFQPAVLMFKILVLQAL